MPLKRAIRHSGRVPDRPAGVDKCKDNLNRGMFSQKCLVGTDGDSIRMAGEAEFAGVDAAERHGVDVLYRHQSQAGAVTVCQLRAIPVGGSAVDDGADGVQNVACRQIVDADSFRRAPCPAARDGHDGA